LEQQDRTAGSSWLKSWPLAETCLLLLLVVQFVLQ
jgi:hypothetical protein